MSKYKNKKAEVNGILFDSRAEAERYRELMLLLQAGVIKDLRLQPEFTLQEAFKTAEGEAVRAVRYRADFAYKRRLKEGADIRWKPVVEDVKGYHTKDYELKRKLMEGLGIHITEVPVK